LADDGTPKALMPFGAGRLRNYLAASYGEKRRATPVLFWLVRDLESLCEEL
jgi:hypothetical protein